MIQGTSRIFLILVVSGVLLGGCAPGGGGMGNNNDNDNDNDGGGMDVVVAENSSHGSSIAVDEGGVTVAAANKATGDVTLFDGTTLDERARVDVGDEPVSVVFSPDGGTLYVVNRASQSVTVITGVDTNAPAISSTISVGSEPTHAALSPTGATLYVANWMDGTLSVIDTATESVTQTLELGGNPHGVCVTNDGDEEDSDESIFVTDFYSRPIAGELEATDRSREGRVFRIEAGSSTVSEIALPPMDVTGIEESIDAGNTGAFANQLYDCFATEERVFVTAVGASPAAFENTTDFRQNVHGFVYAINLSDSSVNAGKSVNLSELVAAQEGEKRFAAVPHSIAFVPGSELGYIAVMTSNSVLRVNLGVDPPVAGAASGANFLETGASPTGIAILDARAFVYNEVDRSITELNLADQETAQLSIESAAQPSGQEELDILRGQRFFNTALARWSTGAWVGCVACHPFGTTDNVTWVFPAGPRQTVDTSATWGPDGLDGPQRILNWTAIFDEIHDFELNTRGVANGVGAIVSDADLDNANRIDFVGAGGVGDPVNGFNVGSVRGVNDDDGVLSDWDEIDLFISSVRSPNGATVLAGDPDAGRDVFIEARCQNCHGGELWTLSERYYTPLRDTDLRLVTFADAGIADLGEVRADQTVVDDIGLDVTPVIGNDANGAPQRHFCAVRIVGTFDNAGPDGRGAAEIRQNGGDAQGVDGFNVPSLLGIGSGAPYLHNGAAETLEDLLDPTGDFVDHLQAGNQVFVPTDQELADLIAFLRTIDDTTPIIDIPETQRFCPEGIVPPAAADEDEQ